MDRQQDKRLADAVPQHAMEWSRTLPYTAGGPPIILWQFQRRIRPLIARTLASSEEIVDVLLPSATN